MTRQRFLKCVDPNCPHEKQKQFSDWVRLKLPDSRETPFRAYDLDWVFWWKSFGQVKKIMLLEVKTHNAGIKIDQLRTYEFLDKCIKNNPEKSAGNVRYEYYGFHVLRFENTFFNDGKVYFDGIESNEQEIMDILSFRVKIP